MLRRKPFPRSLGRNPIAHSLSDQISLFVSNQRDGRGDFPVALPWLLAQDRTMLRAINAEISRRTSSMVSSCPHAGQRTQSCSPRRNAELGDTSQCAQTTRPEILAKSTPARVVTAAAVVFKFLFKRGYRPVQRGKLRLPP